MARTRGVYRKTMWPRRVLAVSLLLQNPTTAAEPALGATTRARSHRIASAVAALPEEILAWEIFIRLPARDILRCRGVCRGWRGLTSAPGFLLAHHRRQPSLLLLTLFDTSDGTGADPTVERGHPVIGLDHGSFKIHASCDGLILLAAISDGGFNICNPATRQCAPLPRLTATGHISIAALYLHRPSGEYRVLYRNLLEAACYTLTVLRGWPRCIGVPSDTPGIGKAMLGWNGKTSANLDRPVVFRDCLHWDGGCLLSDAGGILVFDTVVESFRIMRRPAAATRLCTRLCDMEGSIGFSCFDVGRTVAKIWVLEDYGREVWSFKYHVKLPVGSLCSLQDAEHLVLSHKGDVLVRNPYKGHMFHCDSTGKLLEEFKYDSWGVSVIGPWYKESLVQHDFLRRRHASVGQVRLFERV